MPPVCVIKDETVSIVDYEGHAIIVVNPLIRFRFLQRPRGLFGGPFDAWATTLRHPDAQGNENIDKLVQ